MNLVRLRYKGLPKTKPFIHSIVAIDIKTGVFELTKDILTAFDQLLTRFLQEFLSSLKLAKVAKN
ncbi:hypothetical protein MICCA_3730010 [Microcystis aeruginosa PCC 9432]|jgi:hypothetical protein|uniref:Uncharacterized protein n=5 Tax=Microcystis TaxID=1125 RepID=A0A2H6BPJ9_MICAE|nr:MULTISPECIES: hypothetical protein [Microcystis]ELP53141.1 hypothetical protein O53_4870 [Microcystis aeruginosa TAIHU98]MCA2633298.1 hypothetical protein [Microcystis sp. M20BS1]QHU82376.1 hypothetical protein D3800_02835 [Microcystis aeruginosa NIES-298]REJ42870.1 MAG: hypothetical protein DWQ54_08165 [Microcystis flos-aquae TF09]ROH94041.1 hypothetical protein ED562_23195 [Microcystis aeruginosa FACHB-524]TRT98807.1 MAG: hypothetical protein EWV62_07805 [Microcystis aeruginosa Ma_OC_LR_